MNISIIGTRGIPNRYGGFEQLAEKLACGLVQKGHTVTVYNSHDHPYLEDQFHGVNIVHCYDAEKKLGTAGQFIYDLNCIRDARKKKIDVLLFLGYTSSSIWGRWFPRSSVIVSNMDGLEWKRTKYAPPVQQFLKYAERLAVKYSDYLIADSPVIHDYLEKKYDINAKYIAYGAELPGSQDRDILHQYKLIPHEYYLLIARMEPENNIDMILDGFSNSTGKKFIVVGNAENRYGRMLKKKYADDARIIFAESVFDHAKLDALKSNCSLYFHGHSVGGTNPSLLEAMAGGAVIAAHDNPFNRAVIGNDGYYFNSAADVRELILSGPDPLKEKEMINNNLQKIGKEFNWPQVIDQYETFITECYNNKKR